MNKLVSVRPVLVCPPDAAPLTARAAQVFAEEIQLHTGLRLATSACPVGGVEMAAILTETDFCRLFPEKVALLERLPAPGPEGFRLFFEQEDGVRLNLFAVGCDPRGAFYAMGKLLRLLRLYEGRICADWLFDGLSSTPRYAMRGHQLGYRDKQNTLPCWSEAQFDRYIRDLALFGSNSIELLPPRTDDNLFSREMQLDPFDMMVRVARIVKSYGLDLWLWYPNMGENYPECLPQELQEREQVFAALDEIDGMLIPAGDPGEIFPEQLFPIAEQCATLLHRYHPHAKVMLAPQCFAPEPGWYEAFYREVQKEPAWLWGVCFAPWEKDSIQEMVDKLPPVYRGRIRHYPDVTHDMGCQFALPNRDPAFAIVEGRECCDPRPRAMKHIHNAFAPYCAGSITYSEGVHDDVNKFVWGQQDWDDAQCAQDTVREYVRYFIDPALEEELTRGILLLEDSWADPHPIGENGSVRAAYSLFTDVDARASEAVRGNWRYQLLLLRALADRYIQQKQRYDDGLERQARERLAGAAQEGAVQAIRGAFALLDRGRDEPCDPLLRARLLRLADALHASCGIKLTTRRHGGQRWGRGAWLDMIDVPLSDAQYLRVTMKRILRLESEQERLAAIEAMLTRTQVRPGDVYVDVGSVQSRALIRTDSCWARDPSLLRTPFTSVDTQALDRLHMLTGTWREAPVPRALLTCALSYYDTPLTLRIPGVQEGADYLLRVAYGDGGRGQDVRLTCGETAIHERIEPCDPAAPWREYHVPAACVQDGALTLTWQPYGKVRGVRVSEIFLIRQDGRQA